MMFIFASADHSKSNAFDLKKILNKDSHNNYRNRRQY